MEKLYELVLLSRYDKQECVNRWNYVASATSFPVGTSFALAQAVGLLAGSGDFLSTTGIGQRIVELVRPQVTMYQVQVRAVYDVTDFADIPFDVGVQGTVDSGAALPGALAYGFKSTIVRRDIARGQKRFVGVDSGLLEDVAGLTAPALALAANLAGAMSATPTLSVGAVDVTFNPAVVHKERYAPSVGKTAYRYIREVDGGETAQLALTAWPVEWNAAPQVSSQVSRKRGKGK